MDPVQAAVPSASIVVSYHTSPSPDVWGRIQADLHRQLPLRNLHWKPKNRPLRVIPSLSISFQAFDSGKPATLSSAPAVYLLFVACDVSFILTTRFLGLLIVSILRLINARLKI
jgi:hypothetical protein